MGDVELLKSDSLTCISILEVALGIIDYKDKPKQQDRLKKFYIKLKLANTHKKKADLAYIMLAMLSDMESKQSLTVNEKNKLMNAVKISKDHLFIDDYTKYLKKTNVDKVKLAEKCLNDFLRLENKISKLNAENRNKKPEVKEEEIVKIEIKKAPEVKVEVVKKEEEPITTDEIKEVSIPGIESDIKEESESLILPTEEELDKLLDTKVLPVIDAEDTKPIIPVKEESSEPLKSVNELMDDILAKTYTPEEKKSTRTKQEVIDGIEDYINHNYRSISFSKTIPYEDMEELRRLFPELRSYKSAYYNLDTIENLIETSCINKSVEENNYIDIETLMTLAINAHSLVTRRILTYDLESNDDEYRDARALISNINLANPIKVYENAYNTFFNYYSNQFKEEQREICVSIERKMPYEYKSLFSIKDAIPYEIDVVVNNAKLKATINETIKHEILANNAIRFDDLTNKEVPMLLAYATVYMSDEDVLEIYHALEEKYDREYKEIKLRSEYLTKEDYDQIVAKSAKLQEWFASALIINKSREDSKLRADIKNPELLQENLIYVTRTILKEEPLFISSERTARIKKIEDTSDVKDFYNSSRLKKTQVRVFNNWNKLPKLIILNGYNKKVG
jgi:hypothetical protein